MTDKVLTPNIDKQLIQLNIQKKKKRKWAEELLFFPRGNVDSP